MVRTPDHVYAANNYVVINPLQRMAKHHRSIMLLNSGEANNIFPRYHFSFRRNYLNSDGFAAARDELNPNAIVSSECCTQPPDLIHPVLFECTAMRLHRNTLLSKFRQNCLCFHIHSIRIAIINIVSEYIFRQTSISKYYHLKRCNGSRNITNNEPYTIITIVMASHSRKQLIFIWHSMQNAARLQSYTTVFVFTVTLCSAWNKRHSRELCWFFVVHSKRSCGGSKVEQKFARNWLLRRKDARRARCDSKPKRTTWTRAYEEINQLQIDLWKPA